MKYKSMAEQVAERRQFMHSMRKICILLIPIVFVVAAWAAPDSNTLGRIATALQNKEFDKALEMIRAALKASPENAQLWAMQGAAYAGAGHKKDALASFRSALKISPDYLPALEGAVQLEFDEGDAGGIPPLQRILRLRPDDSISHGMLAVLQYQQGNCSAAVEQFEKAGTLFESKPSALHANAICLVRLKQFDRAVMMFQRVVALNPGDARERHLLASVQIMSKHPEDALATLEPLLTAGTPDVGTLELASAAYEAVKDTERAVSTLRQAILLDPHNVNLYRDFAAICYEHGSFQVGVDIVNDGLGLEPGAAPLYFARGGLYVQLSQYDRAEADFQKAYELDPSQSLSIAAQGIAAAQQHDFDRAIKTVRASLARKPKDPLMLYLQADILANNNTDPNTRDFQLAVASARKAVALQPTLGAAHGVLGKLYLEAGRFPEAIKECRKAITNDPADQASVYHLIQGLRKTGNKNEIPELLKRLATLREQALQKDKERYRYKLVD
jgi:tetratricopeptide (TPR) repeat protein